MYARIFKSLTFFFYAILLSAVCPLFIVKLYPDSKTMILLTVISAAVVFITYFFIRSGIKKLLTVISDQDTALKNLNEDNARMLEKITSKNERSLRNLYRIQELEQKQETAFKEGYQAGREDEKAAFLESLNSLTQKFMLYPERMSESVVNILSETLQRSAS